MKRSRLFIFLGVIIAILMIATASLGVMAANNYSKAVPATVTVVANDPNLGLYTDSACTIPVTSVSFGSINQGATGTATIYIKNNGNVNMTSLSIATNDPTDYSVSGLGGQILDVGNSQAVTISLTVSANASTGTGLDPEIVINATY